MQLRFNKYIVALVTYKNYNSGKQQIMEAKSSFFTLWQSINGDESVDKNPWLWVVKFKVLSTIGKPAQCS